jgi:hypothetical protein
MPHYPADTRPPAKKKKTASASFHACTLGSVMMQERETTWNRQTQDGKFIPFLLKDNDYIQCNWG